MTRRFQFLVCCQFVQNRSLLHRTRFWTACIADNAGALGSLKLRYGGNLSIAVEESALF